MPTETKHNYAVLPEEGVIVVEVKKRDVERYGEEALWESIQSHPLIEEGDDDDTWDVVIAYWDGDDPYFFGDEDAVELVAEIPTEELPWEDEQLCLEWEE